MSDPNPPKKALNPDLNRDPDSDLHVTDLYQLYGIYKKMNLGFDWLK